MKLKYDAFISYSHAKDRPLAQSLQRVIQTLGKPWYRLRSARVFRDETSLTATPELWPTIVEALKSSKFLVLVASGEAASSPWVSNEVEWWLANKSRDTLLLVLSDGRLTWDDGQRDFVPLLSDALPSALFGQFQREPLWIDLSEWREQSADASRDPKFRGLASKIAARLKGVAPEDLWSHELMQQRRNLRTAGLAVVVLLALLGVSVWQTVLAMRNESVAQLASMEAAVQTGNYPLAFANATALDRAYLLTEPQIIKAEKTLYKALWSNRLTSTFKLKQGETLRFAKNGEHAAVLKEHQARSDNPVDHTIPRRHWQAPQAFGTWSSDRRSVRIKFPTALNGGGASGAVIQLATCLKGGDDEYRIDARGDFSTDDPQVVSAKYLLGDTLEAKKVRGNLIAPVYFIQGEGRVDAVVVEITSRATLENRFNQEVLCVVSFDAGDGTQTALYHPDLTMSASSRPDKYQGFRRISPGGQYYVEMESGGKLTLRSMPGLDETTVLAERLGFLSHLVGIDERIAFSKDGKLFVFSGYLSDGDWRQPVVYRSGDEGLEKIWLKGHDSEVNTVAISQSGKSIITIDGTATARVWDLSDKGPLLSWSRRDTRVIQPNWLDYQRYQDDGSYKDLKQKLEGIEDFNAWLATEPRCGRVLILYGANPASGLISRRDGITYMGLLDLEKRSLIYSTPNNKIPAFFFCTTRAAAQFAVDYANAKSLKRDQSD